MANPNYTTQDVPTWAANVDSMNSLKAQGDIGNPLLYMPLLNSLDIVRGAGSVTLTRSSTATYIDRYGQVQSVAVDKPRFEKNGFLMEGENTNIAQFSEQLNNAYWTVGLTGATVATNDAIAPDGNVTADKLQEDTSTGLHRVLKTVGFAAGDNYCSVFAKADERTKIILLLWNGTDSNVAKTRFDLSNGTIDSVAAGSARIELDIFNGYYRCTVYGTSTVTGTQFSIHLVDGSDNESYTGVTGNGVHLWGMDAGDANGSSSYIPTPSSSSVTRSTEICLITIEDNIGLQANPGVVIVDFDVHRFTKTNQYILLITGETSRTLRAAHATPNMRATWGAQDMGGITPTVIGTKYRWGMTHDGNGGIKSWADGDNIDTFAGVDVSDTLGTGLYIGNNSAGTGGLFGHISNLRTYDSLPSDRNMAVM